MLRKKLSLIAVMAGLMLFAGTLLGSMRCGTHLIESGQRHGGGKYEVLKKCGEPKARMGNTWVYDRGGNTRKIKFDDSGRIQSIQ